MVMAEFQNHAAKDQLVVRLGRLALRPSHHSLESHQGHPMTTPPQSMSDIPELPEPSEIHADRWEDYGLGYTEEQMREYGRLCRATAEQAGKVEGRRDGQVALGDWFTYDEAGVYPLAKPTQPAATQMPVAWQYRVDVHRDGNWSNWRPCTENFHDEIIEFGECVEGDDPRGVIADSRALYAAPVSPSREVEALAFRLEHVALEQTSDDSTCAAPSLLREAAAMLRALAPVQASEARGDWTASRSVRKALGKFAAAAKDEAEAGEWSWYGVNHLMANGIDPEAAKFIGYASPRLILALLHDLSAHTQAGPVG
jgi:hypothetical protein